MIIRSMFYKMLVRFKTAKTDQTVPSGLVRLLTGTIPWPGYLFPVKNTQALTNIRDNDARTVHL